MYKQWFEVICYTCSKILWVNHHSLVVIFDRLVMELLVVGTPLWLFTSCCIYQIMSHCTSQYSAFIGLQPAFNRNRYIEGEEKLLRYSYLIVLVELARTSDVLNFKLVKNLSIEEIKQYREEKKVIIIYNGGRYVLCIYKKLRKVFCTVVFTRSLLFIVPSSQFVILGTKYCKHIC